MANRVVIELLPLGRRFEVEAGVRLQDALFAQGVEFPCGGRGRCQGCRVKVLAGDAPVGPEDARLLSASSLAEGWRLACRLRPTGDLRLELAQWEAAILGDDTAFAFHAAPGFGIAVDVGTTTLVVQLLDRETGAVRAVRAALNAQARHGADIMSRIDWAMQGEGQAVLAATVREQIGGMIAELIAGAEVPAAGVREVILVGNTVMHHLFCAVPAVPLAHHPFEPVDDGLKTFTAQELGWTGCEAATVHFLPCLGGFVGSDILAGLLATRLHETPAFAALMDLGTNGEIVVGNQDRLLCASTAAGPAFEGARISMGMRAATGAVSEVSLHEGALRCHVLGNGPARGICGSGLVDAVSCGLGLGWIEASGRLAGRTRIPLVDTVELTQADVRELQLAKGAIAAGLHLLAQAWGPGVEAVTRLHLAGAFGNYINRASARRIGLIPFLPEQVRPAGNTALRGAKLALFRPPGTDLEFRELRRRVRHVPLNDDPQFQDVYVDHMSFPALSPG